VKAKAGERSAGTSVSAVDVGAHRAQQPASAQSVPLVSFEFFPPRDPVMAHLLRQSVRRLAPLRPRFFSVTCGADGTARDGTGEVVAELRSATGLETAPHLTCAGISRAELLSLARGYWQSGVRRVLALRGDIPGGSVEVPGGFHYAHELVAALRAVADFDISVAAYPETHPEAASAAADLDNLKRKIDAGAQRAITQFFFDTDAYLRFRDACAAAGVAAPIVPGILPIQNVPQLLRFARRCGATVPGAVVRRFEGLGPDLRTHRLVAAAVAIEQVQRLRRAGVDAFHFYTLNRWQLSFAICRAFGVGTTRSSGAAQS
jgi:methylenetetrahydrofolate reductase (NADPH)